MHYRALFRVIVGLIAASGAACQPLKEDRTITWSAQGDRVGFQHSDAGVFVADHDGHGLQRVFQPGPDIIATSTPLWSPTDRRLIFTTARNPNQQDAPALPRLTHGDPSGDTFVQVPIVYTCWLRKEDSGEEPAEPQPLFEAACNHVGYVAANLAVRWHPSGDKIVFVDQADGKQHGLFTYDLASGAKERVFPRTADAIVFDWSPDDEHLACVLASMPESAGSDGIWIGRADETGWWRVPGSDSLAPAKLDALLERLKASRPAWSGDGGRFTFVTSAPHATNAPPTSSRIWLGDLANHAVRLLAESEGTIDDLAWSPDRDRLGLIRGGDKPMLAMLTLDGNWLPTMENRAVRRFAGWDASGQSIAYVTGAEIPYADDESWALLLMADPQSRDAVFVAPVAPGVGNAAPREIVSGLRVTFPRWSPGEEKLSLWFTFSPSHRSWLSRWLGWGLLPGDPAAIVDVATGRIDWMAISPWEEAQIGHYHLLKHDYAEAWRRYQLAGKDQPDLIQITNAIDYLNRLRSPRELNVFEYVCLRKLGRDDEASERLAAFRERFPPDASQISTGTVNPDPTPAANAQPIDVQLRELFAHDGLTASLMQDLYIAEVCLSVGAPEEAEGEFRRRLDRGEIKMAQLSSGIVLAQLLLLENRHDEYLDLATEVLVPATFRSWRPSQVAADWLSFDSQGVLMLAAGLTLLPLASEEFLAGIDEARIVGLADSLEAMRGQASDDVVAYAIDVALLSAYERLNDTEKGLATRARIDANPAVAAWALAADVSRRITELRQELSRLSDADFGRRR